MREDTTCWVAGRGGAAKPTQHVAGENQLRSIVEQLSEANAVEAREIIVTPPIPSFALRRSSVR